MYKVLTESIQAEGASRSAITYMSTGIMMLESLVTKPTSSALAVYSALRILSLVLPHVPGEVVVGRGSAMLTVLGRALTKDGVDEDTASMRAGVICMGHVLGVLPRAEYRQQGSVAADALNGLFSLTLHGKAKVRKEAIVALARLLNRTDDSRVPPKTIKFVRKTMEAFVLAAFEKVGEDELDKGSASQLLKQQLQVITLLKSGITALEARGMQRVLKVLFHRLGEVDRARRASRSVYTKTQLSLLRLHIIRVLVDLTGDIDAFGEGFASHPDRLVTLIDSLNELFPALPSQYTVSGTGGEGGMGGMMDSSERTILFEVEFAYIKTMRAALFVLGLLDTRSAGDRVGPFVARCLDTLMAPSTQLASAAMEGLRRVLSNVVEVGHLGTGVLENVLSILRNGLALKYKPVWGGVLSASTSLFVALSLDRTGSEGSAEHNGAVRAAFNLGVGAILTRAAELANTPEFSDTSELYRCVGEAVRAFGPGPVCAVIPMALVPPEDPSSAPVVANDWMLIVLKKYTMRAQLGYFFKFIEPAANQIQARALKALNEDDMPVLAKNLSMRALLLWELFPAFARVPTDLASVFEPMAEVVGKAFESEPSLRPMIASGLATIIFRNLAIVKGEKGDPPVPRGAPEAKGRFSSALRTALVSLHPNGRVHSLESSVPQEEAAGVIDVLGDAAPEFLQLLIETFVESDSQARSAISGALKGFALVAKGKVLDKLFKKVARALLEASTDESASLEEKLEQAHKLTAVSGVLVPGLSDKSLELLYKVIHPQLGHADVALQKASYKVLGEMFEASPSFLARHKEDLFAYLKSLSEDSVTAAASVRLACISKLVGALPAEDLGVVFSENDTALLVEVILATREPGKTSAALELVKVIAEKTSGAGSNGCPYSLGDFAALILVGLTDPDSEVIAGAVFVYTFLVTKSGDSLPPGFVARTFPTMIALLKADVPSIIRSALKHIERALRRLEWAEIEPMVSDLAVASLDYAAHRKTSFRRYIRSIWLRIAKMAGGFSEIRSYVEKEHTRFFSHLRKEEASKAAAKSSGVKGMDVADEDGDSDSLDDLAEVYLGLDSDDDDDNAGSSAGSSSSSRNKKGGAFSRGIREGVKGAGDILDFLDASAAEHMVEYNPAQGVPKRSSTFGEVWDPKKETEGKKKKEKKTHFRTAEDGRIIVVEEKKEWLNKEEHNKSKRKRRGRGDDGDEDDDGSDDGGRQQQGDEDDEGGYRTSLYGGGRRKRKKKMDGSVVESGARFRAKHAGGDVKRGGVDPYAYVKLNPGDLNRRNRRRAVGKYDKIVNAAQQAAKRGGKKAAKNRARSKR